MAHRRWDEDVDARDRLEGQRAHLKMRLAQRGLHGVDDLTREEGRNDGCLRVSAALSDERLELVAVELVADRAVADAVVARRIVDRVRVCKLALSRLHTGKVEVALLRGRNRARDVLFCVGGHRVECASCSRDGGTAQCARALREPAFDLADDGGNLRHVVNLTVEHGARLVLHALCGEDVEQPVALFGNDADDAARADVECKDQLCRAFAAHGCMTCCARALLRTAAFFGGSVLRLFLYALFGTATFFCRRVLGSLFVRFIQIRHVDLP